MIGVLPQQALGCGGSLRIRLAIEIMRLYDMIVGIKNLVSPGFAQSFGSGGEAEGLHFVGVLSFDDEFGEDVVLVSIEEKFGQPLA